MNACNKQQNQSIRGQMTASNLSAHDDPSMFPLPSVNDHDMDSFQGKLHKMLEDVELCHKSPIVSWTNSGRAFKVHQILAFSESIIPIYFNHTDYKIFQRQLYVYGFSRISEGNDEGAYFHAHFFRDDRSSYMRMSRKKRKSETLLSIGVIDEENDKDKYPETSLKDLFKRKGKVHLSLNDYECNFSLENEHIDSPLLERAHANPFSEDETTSYTPLLKRMRADEAHDAQETSPQYLSDWNEDRHLTWSSSQRESRSIYDADVAHVSDVVSWLRETGVAPQQILQLAAPSVLSSYHPLRRQEDDIFATYHYSEFTEEIISIFGTKMVGERFDYEAREQPRRSS